MNFIVIFFWVYKNTRMPPETTSDQERDDSDVEFVEVDPTGRYGRVSLITVLFHFLKILFMVFRLM